jgi:hypothetical protein
MTLKKFVNYWLVIFFVGLAVFIGRFIYLRSPASGASSGFENLRLGDSINVFYYGINFVIIMFAILVVAWFVNFIIKKQSN